MISFHTLEISDIQLLTKDAVAISFTIPENLVDTYQFQHGQFVKLQADITNERVTRSYSICSAPYERKLTVAIKRVTDGVFSNFANDLLKVGDQIDVSEPQGVFTHQLDSSQKKQYLLVAAGSGITPILSILKMILASETMSQCVLIYGNKTPETTMFSDELNQLVDKYSSRFELVSVFSQHDVSKNKSTEYHGRINLTLLNQIVGERFIDEFFVCGPKEMSTSLYEHICSKGLEAEKAHIELFEVDNELSENNQTAHASVMIKIDGDEFSFDYDDSTRSILDIALDHDPDLPYGCQNGSCGSCQAKVISGSVEMEVNYALSQSELDDGFVLVCQSRPTSNKVEIDYDA